ncbi:TraB domain-containing protein [Methanopyrus sp.]
MDRFEMFGSELYVLRTAHAGMGGDRVRRKILELGPEAVLVELCEGRLLSLLAELRGERTGSRTGGITGRLIAIAERIVGRIVGGELGEDVKGAIEAALELEAEIVPVDMDISWIFRRMKMKAPRWELLKFQFSVAIDVLRSLLRPGQTRDVVLSSAADEETAREMVQGLRRAFPRIAEVLIDERNRVIAENTIEFLHSREDITKAVLVIGAAHYGVLDILRDAELESTSRHDDEDTANGEGEEETAG